MVSHSFAQKVSQDQADYWDTDCGSWLRASNDVDHIAAKIHNQHHNREPISPVPSQPQPDGGENAGDTNSNHKRYGCGTDTSEPRPRVRVKTPNRLQKTPRKREGHHRNETCTRTDSEEQN
jgi:hypothetical protein